MSVVGCRTHALSACPRWQRRGGGVVLADGVAPGTTSVDFPSFSTESSVSPAMIENDGVFLRLVEQY